MEEPFDELMGGRSPSALPLKKKDFGGANVVSPDPSPTYASTRGGPPSNAFSSRSPPPSTAFNTSDRWSHYEKDEERLRKESDRATGRAVASAAERAAYREDQAYNGVEVALQNSGNSLPHPDEIKSSGRFSSAKNKFRGSRHRTSSSNSDNLDISEEHDRVRDEAKKILDMVKTPENIKKKRVPAKLAGIDFARSSSRVSHTSNRNNNNDQNNFVLDDMDSDDEEDLVDIVQMQGAMGTRPTNEESSSTRNWSSRYNVDHRVVALSAAKDIVEDLGDEEGERLKATARSHRINKYSPKQSNNKFRKTKVFGSNFAFQAKSFFTNNETHNPKNDNIRPTWMDVDLQTNGKSFSSPAGIPRTGGPKTRKKRRNLLIGVASMILILSILIGASSHHHVKKKKAAANQVPPQAIIDENSVKFYIIADVPYDSKEEANIIRDLETLPGDADFVIHLGNIQDAAVSLCPQQAYISAQAILRRSPRPVFVLPGPNDWNNCPDPNIALNDWVHQLGSFERFFVEDFGITRQKTNQENFAFIHRDVLFIGLHLVGGRRHDKKEWRMRHQLNVRWVEEQLETVKEEKYKAVILLANARPGQQHTDFFTEVFDDIEDLNKPVLYVHASGGSGKFETYMPFPNDSKLMAVQVGSGGSNPPLRIAVGKGAENPFVFSTYGH
eukprot:CAMPEP_0194132266 /NCGR_PEP_ID=MMETSP0152-20130528/2769_1 /TAXON_ID=1049557 /ORGANISM="Thalassiothrix antarctica, Strain L6-D1" /LENGTH=668 /DNA_ID=CAMNT_0038827251 /DNA_START=13 /DNA_END=2019 /DNA_ORIENTATION=+